MTATKQLNLLVAGQGSPTLLFVHGFCCTLDDWRHQMAALSQRFRCVALDLPGHGGSDLPAQPTLAALGAAVNDARARTSADEVVLIGHSLGCKIIREAHAQRSEGVRGLVFVEGAFYDADREVMVERARAAVDAEGFAAYGARHFGAMFPPDCDPRIKDPVMQRLAQMDPAYARSLYLEAVGWDAQRGRSTLELIQAPVLVLQSTRMDATLQRVSMQPGMSTSFMDLVAQTVADARQVVVPGVGHFTQLEAADAVNREIAAFAGRVARTST